MNNEMIATCDFCGQEYCMNCATHKTWDRFCSDSCAKEQKERDLEKD